jgi:hypothetical protein
MRKKNLIVVIFVRYSQTDKQKLLAFYIKNEFSKSKKLNLKLMEIKNFSVGCALVSRMIIGSALWPYLIVP